MAKRAGGNGTKKRRGSKTVPQWSPPDFAELLHVSFSDNLIYWARLLETNLNRAFAARTGREILSVTEWRILAWIIEKESLTVGELARYTHMERTVLGRVLDRMIGKGLVSRKSGSDARISLNSASSKGRSAFEETQFYRDAIYRDAVKGISADRMAAARVVLRTMVRNLIDTQIVDRGAK